MSQHTPGPDPTRKQRPEPVTLAAVKAAGESFGYSSHPAGDRLIFPWNDHRVTVFLMGGNGLPTDDPETLIFDTLVRGELDLSRAADLARVVNEWNRERLGPSLSFRMGPEGNLILHARSALQVRHGLSHEQLAEYLHELMETIQLAVSTLLSEFPELSYEVGPEGDTRQESDLVALQEPLPGTLRDNSIPDLPTTSPPPTSDPPPVHVTEWPAVERKEGDDQTMSSHNDPDSPNPENEDPGMDSAAEQLSDMEESTDTTGRHRRETDPRSSETPELPAGEVTWPSSTRHSLPPNETAFPEIYNDEQSSSSPQRPFEVTLDRVREALADLGVHKTRGDENVIVAWVNEVLFGFFLDNGPSYLVKGHWDPNLDPERDFMRIFLLCNDWNESAINTKAFCHTDSDGLQVRVEFTAPVGRGLNDAQLGHNTEVAINQVLHALDSISNEAIGESVVHWPRPGHD
ncbi:hypothetical protein COCCU_09170 [Corynebacterium occultum]|uniref:Bacterial sensory transduction regulator n=1 Tax=Corynebacterium occultum TaxID=2675219 RepID=A0A6B8WN46_9CORY|nr:YbjN domain-containing protein [Corynebacterium occultum]QGU07758.1 hypothetical protein COCCU_09170 [Corynebacterium occultum]